MFKWRAIPVLALLLLVLVLAVGCAPGRNLVLGQDIEVARGDVHQGDLVVVGGSAVVRQGGRITGDLVVTGGSARVAGQIDGNVVVQGGNVQLDDTAVIRGDLVSQGGAIQRSAGAQVLGESVGGDTGWTTPAGITPPVVMGPWAMPHTGMYDSGYGAWNAIENMVQAVLAFLAVAALGILLIAFVPQHLSRVQQTATEMWPISLGVGFLTYLVAVLVVIVLLVPALLLFILGGLLTVTIVGAIVGIPVILLGVLLLFVPAGLVTLGMLFGWVAISQYVGDRVMAVLDRPSNAILSFLIGLVLISLLSAVPCVGWLLAFGLSCMALGAVVLSRVGTALPPQIAGEPAAEPLPALPAGDEVTPEA